uniref:DUF4806 domain-containing protein n=1 Tax=Anopheles albimanus TaxID=7167 RepID=A0A182F4J9_ANOAL
MSEILELQTQLLIVEQNHKTITDMLHAEIEELKQIINDKICEKCILKDQKYMNLQNKYQALAHEFEANKKKLKELLDDTEQKLTDAEPTATSLFRFPLKVESDLEKLEQISNNERFRKLVVEAFRDRFSDRDNRTVHKIVIDQFISRELVCKCVWE